MRKPHVAFLERTAPRRACLVLLRVDFLLCIRSAFEALLFMFII